MGVCIHSDKVFTCIAYGVWMNTCSGHGFVGLGKRCSCGVIFPVLSMYFVPYALITAEEVLVMDLEQGHVSWIEVTWCPGLSSHQAKGCILQALEMV